MSHLPIILLPTRQPQGQSPAYSCLCRWSPAQVLRLQISREFSIQPIDYFVLSHLPSTCCPHSRLVGYHPPGGQLALTEAISVPIILSHGGTSLFNSRHKHGKRSRDLHAHVLVSNWTQELLQFLVQKLIASLLLCWRYALHLVRVVVCTTEL